MTALRVLWLAAHWLLTGTLAMAAIVTVQLLPLGSYTGGISLLTAWLVLLAGLDTAPSLKGRRP